MSSPTIDEAILIEEALSRWPRLHGRVSIETMNAERRDVLYLLSSLPPTFESIFGTFTEANIHLDSLYYHNETLAAMTLSLADDEDDKPPQLLLADGTPEGDYDYAAQYLNSVLFAPMGTMHPKEVLETAIPMISDCIRRLSTIFLQVGNPPPGIEMVERISRFLQRHMETLSGLAWLVKTLNTTPDCRELLLQLSCYSMYMDHLSNPAVPTEYERLHHMDWWHEIVCSIEEYQRGEITGVLGVENCVEEEEEEDGGDDETLYGDDLYDGDEEDEHLYEDDLYDADDEEDDDFYGGHEEEAAVFDFEV